MDAVIYGQKARTADRLIAHRPCRGGVGDTTDITFPAEAAAVGEIDATQLWLSVRVVCVVGCGGGTVALPNTSNATHYFPNLPYPTDASLRSRDES